MGRPELHSASGILDGARTIVLEGGAPAATIGAIADASDAPAGSIYHRFGSRDALLAELWIRAVGRSQSPFLATIQSATDPLDGAVAGGLSIFDFALAEPHDARLLASLRREDLVRSPLPAPLILRLGELNRPLERAIARLARQLYKTDSTAARNVVALATIDIPYGAVRRHLVAGSAPPAELRSPLERAIRAVLSQAPARQAPAPRRPRRT